MKIISRKDALEQELKTYFTGKPCKHGHVSERYTNSRICIGCCKSDEKTKWAKNYYKNNTREIKARNKKYREANKEKEYNRVRKWERENKDRVNSRRRELYNQSESRRINARKATKMWKLKNKDRVRENYSNWRSKNPMQIFIRKSLERLESNWRGSRSEMESLLDYSWEELKLHIESRFKDGMCWENRSEWHIDHIKPVKAFLDENITCVKKINAIDNLQPLWAFENIKKGAKYEK